MNYVRNSIQLEHLFSRNKMANRKFVERFDRQYIFDKICKFECHTGLKENTAKHFRYNVKYKRNDGIYYLYTFCLFIYFCHTYFDFFFVNCEYVLAVVDI